MDEPELTSKLAECPDCNNAGEYCETCGAGAVARKLEELQTHYQRAISYILPEAESLSVEIRELENERFQAELRKREWKFTREASY